MSKKEKVFIDTNILVYAYDKNAAAKHVLAKDLIAGLWRTKPLPYLSVQVLLELFNSLKKFSLSEDIIHEIVNTYFSWNVVNNTQSILKDALKIQSNSRVSIWDAHIIAAAQYSGAKKLWSEDLNAGQKFGQVKIINPLLS